MNKKISPASYLKERVYMEVPTPFKRKKKMTSDEFVILEYSEYNQLTKRNFNVQQLREMARFYKQRRSGNKSQLIFYLYNFLKFSSFAITIQKIFRGYLRRKYNTLRGPALLNRNKCVNKTDFVSMEPLKSLKYEQFFSIMGNDGIIYGFDICSLYNLVKKKKKPLNPYNRTPIHINIINDMNRIIRIGTTLKEKINIYFDDGLKGLSTDKQVKIKAIYVFQKIDELGNNTNANWFLNLNRSATVTYFKELLDIWRYRANLSPQAKRDISPPLGHPFISLPVNNLGININLLKIRILTIMEKLVTSGVNRSSKALGAIFVITALTLVSKEAAEMRPELYESAVYH